MPVKSSTSSLIKWPDRPAVDRAVRDWARQTAERRTEVLRIGYFGSYARGDWGGGQRPGCAGAGPSFLNPI